MPVLARKRAKPSGNQQRVDSVADIKTRWKISDTEYDKICNSFQDTLAEEGVLGDRIQGRTQQSALTNAIEKMLQKRQHQSVLKSKDTNMMRCDLRYLAQLLNQNYRRRMKRGKRREADQMKEQTTAHSAKCSPGSRERQAAEVKERGTSTMAVHEDRPILEDATSCFKSGTPMSISEKPTQREPPPLTARMLVVRWQDEAASRIYRIQELCPGSDSVSADRLDKLRYEAFLSILVTDFAFSPNSDVVLYNCVDEGIILISNEKIWRAALWDMFNQGDRYLRFRLQRKGTALMHAPSVDTIEHTV